ncbi:hypothetical protein WA026_022498 [Henosepilachna vigintioctopunctata]|uniref:Uncharacterized protein n=1 Tax=Henosepilachna vigintioctopunctata TaxID=420089 RepID=A0AAW1TYJ3_9CUCU
MKCINCIGEYRALATKVKDYDMYLAAQQHTEAVNLASFTNVQRSQIDLSHKNREKRTKVCKDTSHIFIKQTRRGTKAIGKVSDDDQRRPGEINKR